MRIEQVTEVTSAELRRRTQRAFAVFFLSLALLGFGLLWIQTAPLDRNVQRPLRQVLDWNAELGLSFLNTDRIDTPHEAKVPPRSLKGKKARTNGDAGLGTPIDPQSWRISVTKDHVGALSSPARVYDLSSIRAFPKQEITVEFKCIEGWSEIMSFGGTRFLDFVNQFGLATKSGAPVDLINRPDDLYRYVGMETPDGEYYVSIDMKSALNPRTLLAYEQNGEDLTPEHGAPLRLYIPNKYGVKSLKRIGKMTFTDIRPRDYWEADGYDWFLGL